MPSMASPGHSQAVPGSPPTSGTGVTPDHRSAGPARRETDVVADGGTVRQWPGTRRRAPVHGLTAGGPLLKTHDRGIPEFS